MTSHRSPPPEVTELKWREPRLAEIRTPRGKLRLTFGPGSGLSRRAGDPPGIVWGIGDRGPNLKIKTPVDADGLEHLAPLKTREGAKVLPLPDFQPCLVELRAGRKRVHLERLLPLNGPDGPLSGHAPADSAEGAMEPTFDLAGHVLPADPAGWTPKAWRRCRTGASGSARSTGPPLMKVDADGVVRRRWTPQGHALAGGEAVLPEVARRRRLNRGFEGLTVSGDGGVIYAAFQSAFEGEPHDHTAI